MTIKVERQPAITEEIEIQFPVYRCNVDAVYYKCISETDVITVTDFIHDIGIHRTNYMVESNIFSLKSREITEIEFLDKYDEVSNKLKILI